MTVVAGKEVVGVGHVYYGSSFNAVFVTHVEPMSFLTSNF